MSLDLIQDFCFETDEPKLFRAMLATVGPMLFKNKHYRPKLLLEEPTPSCYCDLYKDYWDQEPGMLQLENGVARLDNIPMFHGAPQFKIVETYPDREKAAKAICDARKEPKPDRKWLTTIFDYTEEYTRNDGRYVSLSGLPAMVDAVMEIISKTDESQFLQDFGYCEPDTDGSCAAGYRMDVAPAGPFYKLNITMVHIIYGK